MVTAVVLVNCANDRIPEVAQQVVELDGISEVYSVAGRWDLVVMVRVSDHEDVADVVAGQLDKVAGIERTETLIAFRTYSEHDLEAAFSLGLEPGG